MKILILAGAALTASTIAAGATDTHQIDRIQGYHNSKIEQGRYSGELTRREYRELKSEQARIEAMERKAKADGYVSKRERREINEAQKEASAHIYQETHDRQTSLWRRWLYRNR